MYYLETFFIFINFTPLTMGSKISKETSNKLIINYRLKWCRINKLKKREEISLSKIRWEIKWKELESDSEIINELKIVNGSNC